MSRATWEKLQLDTSKSMLLLNAPDNYFKLIGWDFDEKPPQAESHVDFVHIFSNSVLELAALLSHAKGLIKQNGTIWISHYKKASKKESELDSAMVREMAISQELVDNKICSIDEDWTACRVVIPLKKRRKDPPA